MASRRRTRGGGRAVPVLVAVAAALVVVVAVAQAWRDAGVAATPPPPRTERERAPLTAAAPQAVRDRAPAASPSRPAPPVPPVNDAAPAARRAEAGAPLVSLVIDDCGQDLALMRRAVRSPTPLTFAVIPHLPHSRASAELAWAAGHEVIVHQPMEPDGFPEADPGRGAILVGMRPRQVARALAESFADVPHAVGLNNHMGSRATADPMLMESVLAALAEMGRGRQPLYFLDSRTTASTVGPDVARRHGVPSVMRQVFLDNDADPVRIRAEVLRALDKAAEQGQVVAIGHLKPATLTALEALLPTIPESQARFVFASELVR